MPPSNELGHMLRVLDLDNKDHMTFGHLISKGDSLTIVKNPKGNFDILHFLADGIGPVCVSIFLIQSKRLFYCFEQFYAKLVGVLEIASLSFLDKGYDVLTFLQGM